MKFSGSIPSDWRGVDIHQDKPGSNRERLEPGLAESKCPPLQELLAAVQSLSEGLFIVDRDNRITFMNSAAEALTGWSAQDALGKSSGVVFRVVDGATGEPSWQPIGPAIREDRPYTLLPNTVLIRKDLSTVPIEDTVAPIHNSQGDVHGAVITFRDIAAASELLREVLERVHLDPLTKLPDRTQLEERLNQRRTSTQDAPWFALLYLDLDNFKQINDTLGHLAGDFVLQTTAQRLRLAVPKSDLVCRLGGDEFAVLLEQSLTTDSIEHFVDSLLRLTREPIVYSGIRIEVSISLGVTSRCHNGKGFQELLGCTDAAMYRAKQAGGGKAEWNEQVRKVPRPLRSTVTRKAEHEFEEKSIVLHYQPIIDLATGRIAGAEALTRCPQLKGPPTLPADFIAHAERDGKIGRLGQIVLRDALRQQAQWRTQGYTDFSMHVNVSAVELLDSSYVSQLDRILEEESYTPSSVTLELTESALLHSDEQSQMMRALTERGLCIAIDDFGVGYSNLNYLRRFPISVIKIDRAFLKQVPESEQDSALVRAIIAMAHSLDCSLIAEGVETEAQRTFLQELACTQAQGFLFSQAVTATRFLTLLQENRSSGL